MNNKSTNELGTKLRHGLGTTLFGWFMILTLAPIGIIGFSEYREGKQAIVESRHKELSTINLLLSQQINDYFDSVVTNLFIKADVAQEFLKELKTDYQASEMELSEFTYFARSSQKYDRYAREFLDFLRYYDYSDVILTDAEGNVFYTVNGYTDLGQDMYQGEFASTSFAQALQTSINLAEPRYADVGHYLPLNDQPVSFFILPLVNEREEVEGVLAVQILAYNVQSIFENDNQFSQGLKSYLVGTDRMIRYGTELGSDQTMQVRIDNPLVEDWLEHLNLETGEYIELENHTAGYAHDTGEDSALDLGSIGLELDDHNHSLEPRAMDAVKYHIQSYENIDQELVLGTFYAVNVAGTPLVMISEVLEEDAFATVRSFRDRLILVTIVTLLLVVFIAALVTRKLVMPIRSITHWVNRVASGEYVQVDVISGNNEIGELSRSFSEMTEKLRRLLDDNGRKSWVQDGQAGLNDSMRGEQSIAELCKNTVSYLAKYLDMQTGAMYVIDDDKQLHLTGTYAWSKRKQSKNSFELGEGMVGQAALEQQPIELSELPDNYMVVESGLGLATPNAAIILPLIYEGEVKGVLEFALFKTLTDEQKLFLEESIEKIAIAINSAQYRTRVDDLLEKTTKQSAAMKEQQEELKAVNDELENRAKVLEESQEELQAQSEEMQKSNAELEEKTEMLQQQKAEIERNNLDIEMSRKVLEEKAKELEQASKYKSEFLANMSHELRTPLNSLLLLAQMLADNDEGNLTEDQIESAQVIYNGGKELLELINDILDLSKVEAGKMSINLEDVDIEELCDSTRTLFKPLADDRGLEFQVEVAEGTTRNILSDSQRVMQILKNFLSNGFKFTEFGGVYVNIANVCSESEHDLQTYVAFSVRDTGIGIAAEKQQAIFEAFQQADGSTSRKYGGTGLGLAISREMSTLLGGYIGVESKEGEGTTFTLYLPDNAVCSLSAEKVYAESYSPTVSEGVSGNRKVALPKPAANKKDDSDSKLSVNSEQAKTVPEKVLPSNKKSLLIIEDDTHFSGILSQIAHNHHFESLHAYTGNQGLQLAREHTPKAIILDLGLPDMSGKEVLEQLKNDEVTRDIPVHIISGEDLSEHPDTPALGFLTKPVTVGDIENVFKVFTSAISADTNHVLLLDPDSDSRAHLKKMLDRKGLNTGEASTAEDALASMQDQHWQCLVMEVDLPDATGLEFLKQLHSATSGDMPTIVIHTSKQLSRQEYDGLQQYSNTMIVKGELASERVMDEVSLFIHSIEKASPDKAGKEEVAEIKDKCLEGHKILLVDDDLRNTFALSKGLQALGLEVVIADNGQNALDKLDEEEGIELVLMDIMMPIMDGYEATRQIRLTPDFKDIPVIALTAKAMSDDKAKCIDAGANDYMTKPVDLGKLTEMIKLWLFK